MPLADLWDDAGSVPARRSHYLATADIRTLLQSGRVRFVVADVGAPLRWVPEADCFTFWKSEVRQHVADPERPAVLDEYQMLIRAIEAKRTQRAAREREHRSAAAEGGADASSG